MFRGAKTPDSIRDAHCDPLLWWLSSCTCGVHRSFGQIARRFAQLQPEVATSISAESATVEFDLSRLSIGKAIRRGCRSPQLVCQGLMVSRKSIRFRRSGRMFPGPVDGSLARTSLRIRSGFGKGQVTAGEFNDCPSFCVAVAGVELPMYPSENRRFPGQRPSTHGW